MAETRTGRYNSDVIHSIKMHLQTLIDQGRLQGASFVVSLDGEVVAKEALGSADGARTKPFSVNAIRPVQSIVKTITAIALLQLVEQGQITLEDKAAIYFAEFECEGFQDITLHHLLTHRSGLQVDDILSNNYETPGWIERLTERSLSTEPGSEFSYSNVGFVLLGLIIARVSGKSFEQFVEERILIPLGMTMTAFKLPLEHDPLVSLVFPREADWLDTPLFRSGAIPMACGGLLSTLDDILKMGEMLLNDGVFAGKRILSEQLVRRMTAEGLGLFLDGERIGTMSARTFSHHGYGWSMFTVDPEQKLVAVVFVPGIEDFVAEALHPTMTLIGSGVQ
ncbi:serine hydrolase [Paenibacillus sp. CF384]|uniref:serine hydrolase domain-containing protein n=1 Tax=Paenibacillus sp. CF384 TaxID=1884382 RepID=UPI00089502C0|nr:serine hydrolase domain-containing protein [Paenibacillus sp. CF384]SDX62006.1 CubicO group peptidase, beta-lactamase class C family [Paenibacillus sp. CF384]